VIAVGRTFVSGWVSAPLVLVPSDGVFGPSSPARLPHLKCVFVSLPSYDGGVLSACRVMSKWCAGVGDGSFSQQN
jgi:hypothetical protein